MPTTPANKNERTPAPASPPENAGRETDESLAPDNLLPFPKRMDKEVLRELPLIHFEGKIHLIRSDEDMADAIKDLRRESVLGFDTETKPTFRREDLPRAPAVLQLASSDQAWLFQLRKIHRHQDLFAVLSDPAIEKVGVAPHDDIKGLCRILTFNAQNFTDISAIASQNGVITSGLRNLAGLLMEGRISKSAQVTNWEQDPLSNKQIRYAATDAWVSLQIYRKLKEHLPS